MIFRFVPKQQTVQSLEIGEPKSDMVFRLTPAGVKYGRIPDKSVAEAAGLNLTVFCLVNSAVPDG